METNQVETLLREALSLEEAIVKANGSHYEVIAVGECFDGLSRVKKQQLVYGPLMNTISDGTIHAVSIKAFTPTEWQRERKFILPQ
ncbi:Acid stress protein IbaG [Pseudoalteromonas holothuriae]|uniref:Acid stress protein IbaG n=1 Tax=Pseudoalteromonas holothuriae TaxID=2963714 RepID=A0A9W4R270_9GAMM|nr:MULTISPECIES: BolA family iron metabolism protein IbaG [unclassified Pseudoalteromonas]CAH9063359.1 Acid stress protein IbaG [Pseudoalteromonas sp. CIP111854]CAH9065001.1 Acid stress protein IbaG [Pseudoalteromonas sp. CIP111951]